MKLFNRSVPGDNADFHKKIMFATMFVLSLVFGSRTMIYLVNEEMVKTIDLIAKGVFVLFAVMILFLIVWKIFFIPSSQRYLLNSPDSFVMDAMNKSCRISWISSFLLLAGITVITKRHDSFYPTEFYIYLTMFVMLFVFSISFFILYSGDPLEMDNGDSI